MDTALSEGQEANKGRAGTPVGERPSPLVLFSPVTGEKMLSFSLSFELKYRKDLSVPFYVLLANMNEPHARSCTDVSAEAGCTYKQSTGQGTK